MQSEAIVGELRATQKFFHKSVACLQEKDSDFAPVEGMYTAAAHVVHTAMSVDWFVEGAFDPKGFAMDFEKHIEAARGATSLKAALEQLDAAFDRAVEAFSGKSQEELMVPLPEGPIMGGAPRVAVISGIVDHTGHHRGALTVYSRLRGYTPEMPY